MTAKKPDNQVEAIKQAAKEVLGNYNVRITLIDGVREFEDIAGYNITGEWVAISLKDGSTTAIPRTEIMELFHYIAE